METAECAGCGNPFEWTPKRASGRRRSWCDECRSLAVSIRYGDDHRRRVTCACGVEFRTSVGHIKCRECRKLRPCETCGEPFTPSHSRNAGRFCSPVCSNRRTGKRVHESEQARLQAKTRARRAIKAGVDSEPYTTAEIAERDGYVCQWWECGQAVDMTLSGLDPYGPTIDHRMPISRGGDDTRSNVQLMHRVCNTIKHDRMPV